ncbi:unnamed protein product [Moneuplotes crassus]|uniref:Uncharacterized protein n=1 Tax=Euplotes crassus TaxID=5936 RepID=A0AAD2D2R6_EUPCR|nr:unnamed protein product [Moneuplotes crassus]
MTREDLMEKMNIPQNTPELVIVRANNKGTGFMRNTYDERYLRNRITQEDFLNIIDYASGIMKRLYSVKRNADAMKTNWKNKVFYGSAIIFLVIYMMMATYSPDVGESAVYDAIQFTALGISLICIFYISFFNFIKSQYSFRSYEHMVKKLDPLFETLNKNDVGIEWYVVPGHYWLEVRILPMKKKKCKPLFNKENAPIAQKSFLDSRMIPSRLSNASKVKQEKPGEPMMNNIVSDESEKPYIFSNPLSSVHNDL